MTIYIHTGCLPLCINLPFHSRCILASSPPPSLPHKDQSTHFCVYISSCFLCFLFYSSDFKAPLKVSCCTDLFLHVGQRCIIILFCSFNVISLHLLIDSTLSFSSSSSSPLSFGFGLNRDVFEMVEDGCVGFFFCIRFPPIFFSKINTFVG